MRGDRRDAERVFKRDSVLHQTGGERFFQSPQLPVIESGGDNLDLEIPEAQRALARLSLNADQKALAGETAEFEILSHVLANTAAQCGEKQLGRTHAVVAGPIFGGLVETDLVLAGLGDEAGFAGVLQ